jgi:hypothetical protein
VIRAIWSRLTGGAAPVVAVPTEVPGDVACAIQAASFVSRDFWNKEGGGHIARAVMMLPGRRGAILTNENAEEIARKAWPHLSDVQAEKVARMLLDQGRVALEASRQAGRDADRPAKRRNYATDY